MIEQVIDDLRQTHVIVNAEAGHGKSSAVMTLVKRLKEDEPKTIVKVFDVSMVWYNKAPLKWRQKITYQIMEELILKANVLFGNIPDCVYEIGELDDDLKRFFVNLIIQQDYQVRYKMAEMYGIGAVKNLPRIVYVFEESDTFFDSTALRSTNKETKFIRSFIKVGRNFGLRGICVATAAVGELGTKFRRRSKHLIGKIISDSDYREYNRMSKYKTPKGNPQLGELASNVERFHWIYYNGEISKPFYIPEEVSNSPQNYALAPKSAPLVIPEPTEFKLTMGMVAGICLVVGALLAVWFL